MEIKERKIKGVFEIQLNPHKDDRGFFMRTFDDLLFKEARIECNWVQENHSKSIGKGILRGLHFQLPPYAETKLLRTIKGEVMDVFVDLRKNSPTFGQWDSVILSENKFNCILIPRGFAHGFCSLTENCEITYKVDNYYAPDHESGIIWNDPDLKIDWPINNPILSEKDKKNLSLKEFISKHNAIKL